MREVIEPPEPNGHLQIKRLVGEYFFTCLRFSKLCEALK
jgi:hypothetical protein